MNMFPELQRLIDEAPEESAPVPTSDWVVNGRLIRSKRAAAVSARIVRRDGQLGLNFGWDSGKDRFWPTDEANIRRNYYPIG